VQSGRARNIVGPQVRRCRKAGNLSQSDLAARCGVRGFDVSRASVSQIETGYRGVSDLEMVILAKALGVSLEELVPATLPTWEKDLRPPKAVPLEDET
jgi:transcriptional regulator with XRE-family HTH domain